MSTRPPSPAFCKVSDLFTGDDNATIRYVRRPRPPLTRELHLVPVSCLPDCEGLLPDRGSLILNLNEDSFSDDPPENPWSSNFSGYLLCQGSGRGEHAGLAARVSRRMIKGSNIIPVYLPLVSTGLVQAQIALTAPASTPLSSVLHVISSITKGATAPRVVCISEATEPIVRDYNHTPQVLFSPVNDVEGGNRRTKEHVEWCQGGLKKIVPQRVSLVE